MRRLLVCRGAHVQRHGAIALGEGCCSSGNRLLRPALALHAGLEMRFVAVDRRLAAGANVQRAAEGAGELSRRLEVHQVAPDGHVGNAELLGNDAHLHGPLGGKGGEDMGMAQLRQHAGAGTLGPSLLIGC